MQKTLLLGLIILIASCKKQASDLSSHVDPIKAKVLSLDTYEGLVGLQKGEVKSLLNFLDHASPEDVKLITDKIKSLSANRDQGAPTVKGAERPTIVTDDPALMQTVLVDNTNYNGFSGDGFIEAVPIGVNFNWAILKQVSGSYKVFSKENFLLNDEGYEYNAGSRYTVYSFTHMGSFIGGNAPGISWSEYYNYDTWNPGGVYVNLSTAGTLSGLGYNVDRYSVLYVNISLAYSSNANMLL